MSERDVGVGGGHGRAVGERGPPVSDVTAVSLVEQTQSCSLGSFGAAHTTRQLLANFQLRLFWSSG